MVSIIIPVYNVEKYLRICLESILAQTYTDYEVILVNDGSKDESLSICEEFVRNDSRFRVISQENKGLSSARNTGIREATGEYIYFIDSDDVIDSRLLETVVNIADENKANIVQVSVESVPEQYGFNEKEYINSCEITKEIKLFDTIDSLYNLDRDNQSIAKDIRLYTTVVWTKLYRRSAFKNLIFPEGQRMHEDQMVSHRFIEEAGGMIYVNAPLYKYRCSDASLIRVGWKVARLIILDCYEDRLKCCERVYENASENNKGRAKSLLDYMYYRYLVCCFRNFHMVEKNLKVNESKEKKKLIIGRMKTLLKSNRGHISMTKKLFFSVFVVIPTVITKIFGLRNKILKK